MGQTGFAQSFQTVGLTMEEGMFICVEGGGLGKCSLGLLNAAYKRMTEGKWPFQT